jgi:hypothetical protein
MTWRNAVRTERRRRPDADGVHRTLPRGRQGRGVSPGIHVHVSEGLVGGHDLARIPAGFEGEGGARTHKAEKNDLLQHFERSRRVFDRRRVLVGPSILTRGFGGCWYKDKIQN